MANRTAILRRVVFAEVLVITSLLALLAAWGGLTREMSTIMLFIPLIWAFAVLRPGWMVLCGTILGGVRILVEMVQYEEAKGVWDLKRASIESVWPLLLYVALGVAFYAYRRRHDRLVGELVEAGTQEAKHRLASSLTHDFNNLLTVVIGTSDLMLRDASLSAQQRKDIETIRHSGVEGMSLIAQLRGASQDPRQKVRLDLSELVDTQLELVQKVLPTNIHLVRYTSGVLPVLADRGQMLRVLMNLCLNARDAMPQGGVLTVQTSRRTARGTEYAVLTVSDTGTGIDTGVMGRIFEPFFTTKGKAEGAGLGLSIVRTIAVAHGGTAEAANIPGSGASLSVLIPLDQPNHVTTPGPYHSVSSTT